MSQISNKTQTSNIRHTQQSQTSLQIFDICPNIIYHPWYKLSVPMNFCLWTIQGRPIYWSVQNIWNQNRPPKQRNDFSAITFLPGRLSLPLPPGFRIPPLRTSPSLSARTHHCQSPVTNITKHYTNDKNITHIKKTLQNIYTNITKQKLYKNIKKHYFIEYIPVHCSFLTKCLSSWFEEKILKFKHLANKIYF